MLEQYFESVAAWRRKRAEEYPEDERNLQSAAALDSLADYVAPEARSRDDSWPTVDTLSDFLSDELTLGGEETRREVSRYGYGYNATSDSQHEEFLGELLARCLEDAYTDIAERGGEDETGTLFDFEIEAALDGVELHRRYFESRVRSTPERLEEAVASYREE